MADICVAPVLSSYPGWKPIRDFEGGSRSIQRPAQKRSGGELIDPDLLLQPSCGISVRVHGIVDYAIHPDGFQFRALLNIFWRCIELLSWSKAGPAELR